MRAPLLKDSEFEHYVTFLNGTPRQRAISLQGISIDPSPDPRLLALCEPLLNDRTIALLGLPITFGEVRWLAADAVASLRRVLGISEPVVIPDVFAPVSGGKAMGLLKAAGVESKAGIEGTIETLETLAKMDRQPQRARAGGLVRRADAHLPGRGTARRLGRSAAVGLGRGRPRPRRSRGSRLRGRPPLAPAGLGVAARAGPGCRLRPGLVARGRRARACSRSHDAGRPLPDLSRSLRGPADRGRPAPCGPGRATVRGRDVACGGAEAPRSDRPWRPRWGSPARRCARSSTPTRRVGVLVAFVADVEPAAVLSGAWPSVCPHCGRSG